MSAAKKSNDAELLVPTNQPLKKRYDQAMAALRRADPKTPAGWHARYTTVAQIIGHEPPLYLMGGYTNEKEFIGSELGQTPQAAYRNLRVAKLASPGDVARYGPTRLHCAISYVDAKSKARGYGSAQPGSIHFDRMRISLTRGGKVVVKPLDKVSYAELAEATAKLRPPATSKPNPIASQIEAAIQRSGVAGVRFSATRRHIVLRIPSGGFETVVRELAIGVRA